MPPSPPADVVAPSIVATPSSASTTSAMVLHSNPAAGLSHDGNVDLGFVPHSDLMRALADLTTGYVNQAPVSGFPAPGLAPAGPTFGGLLPPILNSPPMRPADPVAPYGSSYFSPTALSASSSTPPVHFSNSLPVRLTPDNYLYWRAQFVPLLRSHSLECFVDGSCPCPPPTHPAYRAWIAQDQAILSALQSSLSEGVAGVVLFATTSREVWATLETNFSSQSSARSMAIRA
jgi:hypothetical protein